MRIVPDTGPIIELAKIGMIDLLRTIATEVLIPPFVQRTPHNLYLFKVDF